MHKGYAFVQFTNPFDARNACHGEDGRTVLSQVLGEFSFSIFMPIHSFMHTYVNGTNKSIRICNINLKSVRERIWNGNKNIINIHFSFWLFCSHKKKHQLKLKTFFLFTAKLFFTLIWKQWQREREKIKSRLRVSHRVPVTARNSLYNSFSRPCEEIFFRCLHYFSVPTKKMIFCFHSLVMNENRK
jgi:hypothetical protein